MLILNHMQKGDWVFNFDTIRYVITVHYLYFHLISIIVITFFFFFFKHVYINMSI